MPQQAFDRHFRAEFLQFSHKKLHSLSFGVAWLYDQVIRLVALSIIRSELIDGDLKVKVFNA